MADNEIVFFISNNVFQNFPSRKVERMSDGHQIGREVRFLQDRKVSVLSNPTFDGKSGHTRSKLLFGQRLDQVADLPFRTAIKKGSSDM